MALLVAGVGLIGASVIWPMFGTTRLEWSNEMAVEHQAASANLHALSHKYSDELARDGNGEIPAELRAARERFNELSGHLDSAKRRPAQVATLLGIAGVAFSVAGALAFFAAPRG